MNHFKINFSASRFGIILGLFGLSKIWKLSNIFFWGDSISNIVTLATIIVWTVFMFFFILKWFTNYEETIEELNDPIKSNYFGLAAVTMILIAIDLLEYNQILAKVLFVIGMVSQLFYGVFFTEKIWRNSPQYNFITPSLYLPTVAGNFVAAMASGVFHYSTLGYLFLGIGFFSWLSLESIIMNRLKKETLPSEFKPSMGIMIAPPAIAGAAYLSLNKGIVDQFVIFLLGYALFQFFVFMKILPTILKKEFDLSFWAFSFGLTTLSNISFQSTKNRDDIYLRFFVITLFVITNLVLFYLILNSLRFIVKKRTKIIFKETI